MTTPAPTTTDALRAAAHRGAIFAAAGSRVVDLPWGSAVVSQEIPRALDLNLIRVEHDAAELTAQAVDAVASRIGVQRVEVWDERVAERLLPGLEAAGWSHDSILLMEHRGPAPAIGAEVSDVGPTELEALREEWLRAEWQGAADLDAIVADILRGDTRLRATTPWRAFCVRDTGVPVAMAWLLGEGQVRMVEDVYVTPSQRGRGFGAAVVAAAVRAADADLVYLPTDARGPARGFYARLGFGELDRLGGFLRRP